jgi:hypothetical protein
VPRTDCCADKEVLKISAAHANVSSAAVRFGKIVS